MEPALETGARQEILEEEYEFAVWDQTQTIRCFVHPCDSIIQENWETDNTSSTGRGDRYLSYANGINDIPARHGISGGNRQ